MSISFISYPDQPARTLGRHLLRVAAILVFLAIWILIYIELNARGAHSERAVTFRSPIDRYPWIYQPWTAVIYVFGGYLSMILPFLWNWTGRWIRFALTAYGIASVMAFLSYAIWPVVMLRPEYVGDGIGIGLMRSVVSVDDPANCFPSSHVLFALLGAMLVAYGNAPRWVKTLAWILGVSICATTITVGQHYFFDILGGMIVAVAGFVGAYLLFREKRWSAG